MTFDEFFEQLKELEKTKNEGVIEALHKEFFSQKVTFPMLSDLCRYAEDVASMKETPDKMSVVIRNLQRFGNHENWDLINWDSDANLYYEALEKEGLL